MVLKCWVGVGISLVVVGCAGLGGSSGSALHVRTVNVQATFLVGNPVDGQIYYLTGAPGGGSLSKLNPSTGAVSAVATFPYKPSAIAIASDGHTAYVDFMNDGKFAKVDLVSKVVGAYWSLGSDPTTGDLSTPNLAVVPGSPDSVVISYSVGGYGETALFTKGVKANNVMHNDGGADLGFIGPNLACGSFISLSLLYITHVSVNSSGVTFQSSSPGVPQLYFYNIAQLAGGRVYLATGEVLDPQSYTLLGTCTLPGQLPHGFCPVPGRSRAYYVDDADELITFETGRFTQVNVQPLPEAGNPFFVAPMASFGDHGLAYMGDNQILLIDNAP